MKMIYCLLDLSTDVSHGFKDQKSYQRLAFTNTMAHSIRRDRQALTEVSFLGTIASLVFFSLGNKVFKRWFDSNEALVKLLLQY